MLANGHTLRNRYHIQRLLGQGGMGAVYLAQDVQQPGRRVAVKEMVPVPNTSPRALVQARDQFRREAQVLMALRHHNLPQVYEYFSEAGNEYLVMQYVEGRNLQEIAAADWGQGRILGEGRVLGWAIQIMDALEYLHNQRPYLVLHRDIKPQNIILTPGGELYLVDFGLVKLLDATNPQTVTALRGMGTPEYAPPEQYATGGAHTGPYSDVYALGASLYYLLAGQSPATATERLLPAPMTKPLILPRQLNPAISPSVEEALVKALELAPADRFASVADMRRALLGQSAPPKPFPVWLAVGAGVGVLLVVAALILIARPRPATTTPDRLAIGPTLAVTPTPSPGGGGSIPSPMGASSVPSPTPTRNNPTATPTGLPSPTATDTSLSPAPTHTPLPPPKTEEFTREDAAKEWSASGHAAVSDEAFKHWNEDDPPEIPVTCAKCHSTPGFLDFLGADGSTRGEVDQPAPTGTLIMCDACHNDVTQRMDSVLMPSGVEITGLGREAVCIQCHQGRQSGANIADVTRDMRDDRVDADLGFVNVHYFAAAATQYGTLAQGGYEYDDQQYVGQYRHVPGFDACIACHSTHGLVVKVQECGECHAKVKSEDDLITIRTATQDYDGDGDIFEGIYYEIEDLRELLYQAIRAYASDVAGTPIVYTPDAYPYFFADTNADAIPDENETTGDNWYNAWTPRLLKAAYNYQVSVKDPGAFAHGGRYILQLLYDSIEDINAALASPMDLSNLNRPEIR